MADAGEPYEGTKTWLLDEERDTEVGLLAVVSGPDEGQQFTFTEPVVRVGSGPTASIQLSDPSVSRLHLELRREGGRVHMRDLGSKNGTWLGGAQVVEAWLSAGSQVRIGGTVIEMQLSSRRMRQPVFTEDRLGPLVGASDAMRQIFAKLAKIAQSEGRVVVRGESGTGKEVVARALHELGPRARGPLVVVDGAGLSPTLAGDELFGHVRGAFTDAHSERRGAFERAHGGTLFLDEVGDIPLEVQKKLLRAMESGTVQRIGGEQRFSVDVRIIAATHKPLEQMVNEGTFREDLLYRLSVFEVRIPPLRERREDIPLLARHLLREVAEADAKAEQAVDQALESWATYSWPGNVRELRNFVHRVAALGTWGVERPPAEDETAAPRVRVDLAYSDAKEQWLSFFETKYVSRILDEAGGNVSEAARRAGMSRVHMSNLARRLGLRGG